MNVVEDMVIDKLLATTAVTNAIGQRIYPRMAPQNATKPYLVVQKLPNTQKQHDTSAGTADRTISFVSVTAYGATYKESRDTASTADTAIDRTRGTFGGVWVSHCLRADDYDVSTLPIVDDELGYPGYRLIYNICHAS